MGVCSQVIFSEPDAMMPIDLVTLRLLFAGLFLLITAGPSAIGVLLTRRNALEGAFRPDGPEPPFVFERSLSWLNNSGKAAFPKRWIPA